MRKVITTLVLVASAISLLHCAGSPSGAGADTKKDADQPNSQPVVEKKDAGTAKPQNDAGAPDVHADVIPDRSPPPKDSAAPPPKPPPPSAACTALAECCTYLTDSTDQGACWVALDLTAEHSRLDSVACGAAFAYLTCADAVAKKEMGPNCAALVSCCNSQQYGQYINTDTACTDDWKAGNEELCDQDLVNYYNDDYGDCL